jgi:hypothetical protein
MDINPEYDCETCTFTTNCENEARDHDFLTGHAIDF